MNNLKKYSRLFTFGCSFTQYHWPTWADILGQETQEFQNWGQKGAGNDFILNRLMECHQRNTIDKNDLVVVMWSGHTREDHYYNHRWWLNGNVYTASLGQQSGQPYSAKWLDQFRSNDGYLLKTLNYITAAKLALDAMGCEYYFLSMVDIGDVEFQGSVKPNAEILEPYREILNLIKPSIHSQIYNKDWLSQPCAQIQWEGHQQKRSDPHPTPARHRDYLNKTFPDLRLSKGTEEFVDHWEQRVLNLTIDDHAKIVYPILNGALYPVPNIQAF